MPAYRAQNAISALGPGFYDAVEAAAFPQHRLRYRNDRAAAEVGLAGLSDAEWVGHFGRFEPLPDNLPEPLALRYHGHQFRTYNPELGDGRGFLFAQMLDGDGRLMDLGTKGLDTQITAPLIFAAVGDGLHQYFAPGTTPEMRQRIRAECVRFCDAATKVCGQGPGF